MSGKILNYYAGGNTARGFHNLYESNLQGLDRLFILKGGPGTGKSSMMKDIGEEWLNKGYDIELLHCSSDNHSIDGVIIKKLNVGIVDGTAPHVIEPKAPGVIDEYVNLGVAWDSAKLVQHKDEILKLNSKIAETFQSAYDTFWQALKVHDEWEEIYIKNMNFDEANALTEELIAKLFGEINLNKQPDVRRRFLGAATPEGAVDFVPNITEGLAKRYFIKGRPGSGKSTMLKKLAKSAEDRGLDVEIYHCGFDPNSLDMVIVRELGFAIFDSTAPHEYFPEKESDEIIDMYERAIVPGTDEKYAEEIKEISGRYRERMQAALSLLSDAKQLRDELESYYIEAMDFSIVEQLKAELRAEIESIAQKR
ncbi:PRK06851 family protein [Bacillus sp. Marseille-P3661]|uniref:PRK06851 family protein n=1 Tax=Bacillus sp. Marseille-P3661 TaxID=1936234 RepID=UPI000C823D93|nr:PRK06851 family protein [Bacillus sp. Marseille-P3661]